MLHAFIDESGQRCHTRRGCAGGSANAQRPHVRVCHTQVLKDETTLGGSLAKRNGYWQKHPKPHLQALLMLFHKHKWRIFDPPTYYKVYCPCPGKHKTMVHLSPSDPNYARNKQKWLERQPCYKKEAKK